MPYLINLDEDLKIQKIFILFILYMKDIYVFQTIRIIK